MYNNYNHKLFDEILQTSALVGFGETFAFPLVKAKIKLQLQGEYINGRPRLSPYNSTYHALRTIAATEGFSGLYNGLLAGYTRRLLHYAVRYGSYDSVKKMYASQFDRYGLFQNQYKENILKVISGATADILGGFVCHPIRLVKIRMQGSTGKSHTLIKKEFSLILQQEGVTGLWRGITPCLWRAIGINIIDLIFYEGFQIYLHRKNPNLDHLSNHVIASFFSTCFSSILTSPMDVVKNRVIYASPKEYKNTMDCVKRAYHKEGIRSFYKGFTPYYFSTLFRILILKYFMEA